MAFLMGVSGATALALAASSASGSIDLASMPKTWAGHQVTLGRREIPIQGEVQTRTDTFFVARLKRRGKGWAFEQEACRVRFKSVAGVRVSIDASALPSTLFWLKRDGEDRLRGYSLVAWTREDVDDDGHDGVTVEVRAPLCSGDLYVANRAFTEARLTMTPERWFGRAEVHVVQSILGARGACLSVVAAGTSERQAGPFAYVPVDDDATCESLFRSGWPVDATMR